MPPDPFTMGFGLPPAEDTSPLKPDIYGSRLGMPATAGELQDWFNRSAFLNNLGLTAAAAPLACVLHRIYLSAALLHHIMPALSVKSAAPFIQPLTTYLNQYDIVTVNRMAAFFGNTAVESAEYRRLEEITNYTHASRLMKIFPREFPSLSIANQYVGKPEAIANRVYANRLGNGNEASGDGWRFRGRGLIQITGRHNYTRFQQDSGVQVVANPDLVATPLYAVYTAAWFWHINRLNSLADSAHYKLVAVTINGKNPPLGWAERETFRKSAAHLLLTYSGGLGT